MTDPYWLPSAIMQTMGAIIGIYVVIYVFVIQLLRERHGTTYLIYNEKLKIKLMPVLHGALIILLSSCLLTIVFNFLWLDYLTVGAYGAYYTNCTGQLLQWLSTHLFLISIFLIFIFSCLLIDTAKGI